MPQEQKRTGRQSGAEREAEAPAAEATAAKKAEDLKGEMDDILEEIDSVLEQNAEEFVKSYVQKGGE